MRWPAGNRAVAVVALSIAAGGCGGASASSTAPPPQHTTTSVTTRQHVHRASYVTPVVTIQLAHPLAEYTAYVEGLAQRLPHEVDAIETAASNEDVAAAETAWRRAHVTYLEIGQDDAAYGSFGELGEQIDGLADGLPDTTANPNFTGFHKVELDLWRRHDTAAAASDSRRAASSSSTGSRRRRSRTTCRFRPLAVDGWVLRCHEILEDGLRDSLSRRRRLRIQHRPRIARGRRHRDARDAPRAGAADQTAGAARSFPTATAELRTLEQAISRRRRTAHKPNLAALPAPSARGAR